MAGKARIGEGYYQVIPVLDDFTKTTENALKKSFADVDGKKISDPLSDEISDNLGENTGKKTGEGFKAGFAKVGIAAGIITAVGVAVGKVLYDIGDTFNEVEKTIRIGTGATGEALEGMVGNAKNLLTEIPTTTEDASSVIADLNTRLGLTGDSLEGIAKQTLEASRILGEEVDINAMSGAFKVFGKENDELEAAMDSVFQVSQATGVSFNELLSSAQSVAPAAKILGFSFEETTGIIGMLDKAGLDATTSFAAMQRGIINLAKEGEAPAEAFSRVSAEIEGMINAGQEAEALNLASEIFGTRGAVNFTEAIKSGTLNLSELQENLGATGDTIIGVGQETMDFSEKFDLLKNKALVAIEPIATTLFDILSKAIDKLSPIMDNLIGHFEVFAEWLGENEWAFYAIAAVIGGAFVIAIMAATAMLWAMVAPVLANPITWIILAAIAAIGLLIAAIWWLVENWDTIISTISNLWNGFIGFIVNSIESIGEGFVNFGRNIGNFFVGLFNMIITGINFVIQLINGIRFQLPDFLGGGRFDGFNIPTISQIPQMAAGGQVNPTKGGTLALLAEAGKPETVVDSGKMNSLIDSILSDGTGGGTTINVYQQPGESTEELATRLYEFYEFNKTEGSVGYHYG